MESDDQVVEAIHDLTRVVMALSGKVESTSDAVRKMSNLGIPPSRIAAILAIPLKDVTTRTARDRKKERKTK
jgi:hypothetical protein